MNQEFFSFGFKSNNIDLFVEVSGVYDYELLKTGNLSSDKIVVKKSQGKKAYDVVRLQDSWNFLISEKLKNALENANLTGWKTYQVESEDLPTKYYGFQCIGKCGPAFKPKQTGFITGYSFDISTWDGSDFFITGSTMHILCTEKAMNVLNSMKIKNIELENIKTLKWYNAGE
ncbi:hypothetical protein [Adhaeribacter terreus]|uniref:Uncharacterized protein n=1 Tax=Adhaeribacter terreus TaxID=529703 RepID=A0ABW0EA79_9BACT